MKKKRTRNRIADPVARQYAEFVFVGTPPGEAFDQIIALYGEKRGRTLRKLSNDPAVRDWLEDARRDAVEPGGLLMDYNARRVLLDEFIKLNMKAVRAGSTTAGQNVVQGMRQIHQMVATGTSDEFSHLSIDELKRLAGEF